MPELKHFDKNSTQEEIERAILSDGGCIYDSLLPEELCDELMADFGPHIDAAPWNNAGANDQKLEGEVFFGLQTKRFHGLPSMSARCAEVIAHPLLNTLAESLLGRGERCRSVRVSTLELMVLGNGQANQMLHRDFDSWQYYQRDRSLNALFSANIAMCDFTTTNGATVVVPGSHRWPDGREAKADETCLATMKKGSALLYSGDVVHGGGSNTEDHIRTGLYIGYIPSWLTGLENHLISNDPSVLDQFDEKVQKLLGKISDGFMVVP